MSYASAPARPTKRRSEKLAPQKHQHGAAAALGCRRLAERQHFVAHAKPASQLALEHRLAVARAKALAVDDPHAARSPQDTAAHELRDAFGRLQAVHAVQV